MIRLIGGEERHLGGVKFHDPSKPRLARSVHLSLPSDAPRRVVLWPEFPVLNQLGIGSCGGHMLVALMEHLDHKAGRPYTPLSRRFAYDAGRWMEGVPLSEDSGIYIGDGFAGVSKFGVPSEAACPYDHGLTFGDEPSEEAKAEALTRQMLFHYHCPDLETILASIAQGFPVGLGTQLFEGMQSQEAHDSGEIRMPMIGEPSIGAHALPQFAYDMDLRVGDETGALLGPNSWGIRYGESSSVAPGWYALPFAYVGKYATDAHTARRMELP